MQRFCNLLERIITKYPQLAEAKADAFMKALADRYEDQVDHSTALRNKVDRAEIEYAIEFFKRFQNSIEPAEDRDITKWTIQELLQFLKSKPGYKPPTEEEEEKETKLAPPIAFPKEGTTPPEKGQPGYGITVYDGSNEDRCVIIGKGERWCITKGSFANYRYDPKKKFPTFYLVKDSTLPASNPKSFFVVMVGNDGTYKASDRTNNDIGGRGSEWDKWETWSGVEKHFPSVEGLESYFEYQPIREEEMDKQGLHTLEDWYYLKGVDKKNQRLINALRQNSRHPFQTVSGKSIRWDTFIRTVLSKPEYKPVTDLFVKSTYENPEVFLQNYELFSPAQQKSIIANTNNPQHPVGMTADRLISDYEDDDISYKTVVDLLKANKIKPTSKTHLYLTGRDNIVYLKISDDVEAYIIDRGGMDQKKLTAKTEQYLLDDPNLATINLQTLAKTAQQNGLTQNVIQKATSQESEDRDVVKAGDASYILQYGDNSVSIVTTSGTRTSGTLPKEVVDNLASSIKSNAAQRTS
jgi:hypothetical protein